MASIMRLADLLLLVAAAGWTAGTLPARSEAPETPGNRSELVASPGEQPGDSDIDWRQLDVDGFTLTEDMPPQVLRSQRSTPAASGAGLAWTSHDKADGSAALTAKRSVSSLWNAQVGTDLTVIRQPSPLTASELAAGRLATNAPPSRSSGQAWAAVTAPGLGRIWDKTALEARIDPARDQTMLDTSLSKSLPLSDGRYALTLRNGYNVIQQDALSVPGIKGTRHHNTDHSARLSVTDTGTSLIAGQSLSSTDNKWLRRIGAEQKLSDGISITGAVSETPQGPLNASLTAAFKRTW
ncbi:hypothetical protein [Nitrobacter winogradskyi]|uniref:Uncharacterized protein n=2 Tax=Nitrobacter winogradskyi TaxID=913 RepID=A0ACC6AIW3_NITWI|nr:hypothetical protein [Nitrobacter winogradskyi]MCP1999226.1 hypothetical protein [Nitrobacter winogradskyi]